MANLIQPDYAESEEDARMRKLEAYYEAQREPAPAPPPEETEPALAAGATEPAGAQASIEKPAPDSVSAQALPEKPPAGANAKPLWAQQYQDMRQPSPAPAPAQSDGSGKQLFWATAADLLLNRGRNMGGIVAQHSARKSSALDDEYKRAQIAHLRGGTDPARAEREAQRIEIAKAAEARKLRGADDVRARQDPNSDRANAVRKMLSERGVGADLSGLSVDDMIKTNPAYKQEIENFYASDKARNAGLTAGAQKQAQLDTEHDVAPRTAGDAAAQASAVSTATFDDRAKLAAIGQGASMDRARFEQQDRRALKDEAYAQQFNKDQSNNLGILGMMRDVEAAPGGILPQSLTEKLGDKSSLIARGIDPERMPAVVGKRMVMEKWAREQTGAAISKTEDGKFVQQTATNPYASDEEITAAWTVLQNLVKRDIAGAMAANPEAADPVLRARGLPSEQILPAQRRAKPQRAPAPTPGAAAETVPGESEPTISKNADGTWDVDEPGKETQFNKQLSPAVIERLRAGGWRVNEQ